MYLTDGYPRAGVFVDFFFLTLSCFISFYLFLSLYFFDFYFYFLIYIFMYVFLIFSFEETNLSRTSPHTDFTVFPS